MNHENIEICPYCLTDLTSEKSIYQKTTLSVLIPVYNEENTLKDILQKIKQVKIPKEIIFVDDGSTDGTTKILKSFEKETESSGAFDNKIKVIFQPKNLGKGAALHKAIEEAAGQICIVQDADMEYDPKDYYKLLNPIVSDRADVVYGSRFQGSGAHRVLYFWHYLGNRLITFCSNMFTNLNLSDVETCYKTFRTDILKNTILEQKKFGFEIEITAKIAKRKYRIFEVGIDYFGRTYEEGKKITWKDGAQALYLIFKYH